MGGAPSSGNYVTPADVAVTCSWQCHKDRKVPSLEPGTDYATAYGTDLRMAGDGVVSVIDRDNGGAEGRRLGIDLSDGRRVYYIHLSKIGLVQQGTRVTRGQAGIAWSGASGFGKDRYYDPHVHVTLMPTTTTPYRQSIDFALYASNPTPPPYLTGEAMEIVLKAPNGVVTHFSPGVKYDFKSVDDYNRIRGDIEFFRARGGIDALALPELGKVVGVDWPTFKRFAAYFGVEEG